MLFNLSISRLSIVICFVFLVWYVTKVILCSVRIENQMVFENVLVGNLQSFGLRVIHTIAIVRGTSTYISDSYFGNAVPLIIGKQAE